ncbi:MAG: hypothetical protein RL266_247 [Bacteroidota bacterium]|jgi:hypothetical protein
MKNGILSVVAIGLVVVFAELIFRLIEFGPFKQADYTFTVEPEMCFTRDNAYGLGLIPGHYSVTVNGGLTFAVNHATDSTRICTSGSKNDSLPGLFMMGCSYTYGLGVDDSLTYPFLVQGQLPEFHVVNYAAPGFGTLQAFMILRDKIEQGEIPKVVVLNHADFHGERNLMTKGYCKRQYSGMIAFNLDPKEMNYPRMVDPLDLELEKVNLLEVYSPLPGAFHSAIVNSVDNAIIEWNRSQIDLKEGINTLVLAIDSICTSHKIEFLITEIEKNSSTSVMEQFCASKSIPYAYIAPDFDKGNYRCLPFDYHPNAMAHEHYAASFIEFFNRNKPE